jgi:HEXXH motif-containing protein
MRIHELPGDVFRQVAAGGGGATAARLLCSAQHSKHLLLLRGVVDAAAAARHAQAGQARHAYELLADIQQLAPDAVDGVIRHPAVGAWAGRVLRALRNGQPAERAQPAGIAALACAAAIRAGVTCAIEVPITGGTLSFPSVGAATLPTCATTALVRCGAAGAEVIAAGDRLFVPANPQEDTPGWQALRRITAHAGGKRLTLIVDDVDPNRTPAATNLRTRLSAAEIERWAAVLQGAWTMLVGHHGTTAEEIRSTISVLTPLEPPPTGHVSATSSETFGTVAASTPPDPRTFAATLAHEVQHAKLTALLDIVALTRPDDGRRCYAPWRDDPRPISGLLQGAYAYLGVTGYWRRQRLHETGTAAIQAHAEFARWCPATALAVDTLLASARLTASGEAFVAEMARTLGSWRDDPVPGEARRIAERATELHRARWHARHGATLS